MKRLAIILSCVLLFLASCSSKKEEDIVQPDNEGEQEISVIPNYSLSENQYKIMLPYRPSAARGAITNQISNRVDINELEEGLRRHSTDMFDPKKYVFEEGQYLSTEAVYDLIDSLNPKVKEKKKKEDKIKEHRKNPRVFSHVLEQNFLERKDNRVELVGVSIGISLKSVYKFQTEVGGPDYYEDISKDEMLKEGKKIAEKVLAEVREQVYDQEGIEDIPVMIALFREEEQSSPVPGSFVAKTEVKQGDKKIGKWETLDEEHVMFPSNKAKDKYYEDYQKFKEFSDKLEEYFPNYVGIVGNGFYVKKDLNRMSVDVPIEFYGQGEVVGFTQYAYGLVKEIFPNHYDFELEVTSADGVESVIFRQAGDEEPTVHIFN